MSTNAPLDRSPQYTESQTTSNFSVLSTPSDDHYRWNSGEHLPRPPTPPLPPVLENAHVSSSPAVSRVAYDPQHEPTMPTMINVTRRREYARELALFDATYAHVAFSSTEVPTVAPYQERPSTEIQILQQPQIFGNGPTAGPSRSPLNPSEDRYRCDICGLDFKQKRGVTRHCRDVHEFSLCLLCSGFEWHRRHQLKEHLEEQHPDIHVPAALAEATRYRRRATMIRNRRQGQQAFPPAIAPPPNFVDVSHWPRV